jgi:hypothetical protein
MQLIRWAQRTTPQIRVALAALLLAFALNVVAHSAHTHGESAASSLHAACGYCAAFDGTVAPPAKLPAFATVDVFYSFAATFESVALASRPYTSALPRGPPDA